MFFIFLQLFKKYGRTIAFPSIVFLIILFLFLQPTNSTDHDDDLEFSTIPQEQELKNSDDEIQVDKPIEIMVDVKGAVNNPGVYVLTTEDRVIDAINLAGGYRQGAETKQVNHAQKLQDEMIIYIPEIGEEIENNGQAVVLNFNSNTSNQNTANSKVNINHADISELTTLPGIGPSKAQSIIDYRDEIGTFQQIEDLKNVTGIGEKTFEKLRDLIDVK